MSVACWKRPKRAIGWIWWPFRYNILYDNVLFYAAVLAHAEMYKRLTHEIPCHQLLVNAADIYERINLLMWIDRCWGGGAFC